MTVTSNGSSSSPLQPIQQHEMAASLESEISLEFDFSYSQLIEHTYLVSKQYASELMSSDYNFPSNTWDDLRKYCRFDTGDILLIIVMTIAWTVLRWLTTEVVFKPASRYFQLHPSDGRKSPESCWKFLFYTGTVTYNSYLLFFNENYNFFHQPGFVWEGWTLGMAIPSDVYFYYMIQGSFYTHSIFATLFMDVWRKDSIAMLIHHFITCSLIFLSYGLRYCNIGLLVFFLMDMTDVELEFTKLNVYLKGRGGKQHRLNEYISVVGFILFTVTWLVARLYWYPTRALYSASVLAVGKLKRPFSAFLSFLLWLIFVLNVYWFLYIAVFLFKVLTGQLKELVDTREFEPSSESSEQKTPLINGSKSHNGLHSNKNGNNRQKLHADKKKA